MFLFDHTKVNSQEKRKFQEHFLNLIKINIFKNVEGAIVFFRNVTHNDAFRIILELLGNFTP